VPVICAITAVPLTEHKNVPVGLLKTVIVNDGDECDVVACERIVTLSTLEPTVVDIPKVRDWSPNVAVVLENSTPLFRQVCKSAIGPTKTKLDESCPLLATADGNVVTSNVPCETVNVNVLSITVSEFVT